MSTKDAVLALLVEREDAVSGEWMARKLGVTRNAVWKAIGQLREEGYAIDAVTNRGYRLSPDHEIVSEPGIRRWLTAKELGSAMEVHAQIGSTNERAKQLAAQGAAHGTLVVGREQSVGHGRFGRSFYSPKDSGIYLSLILRPTLPAQKAVMITSMAAVAVARAVERLADVRVEIKWVNDLYIRGRKICGILCEASLDFESAQLEYVVAGIGLNSAKMAFPEELQSIATSVGNECGHEISKNRLIAEICNCMEELYPTLGGAGFMAENRARSNVIGHRVRVIRGDESYAAKALDIDDEGGLVVETEDGVRTVQSGEISIRWED